MADLPEISQNLDDPLPQVDPGSSMVPYRMARTAPGGQPVVTTGYGPRARPPIQPPEAFGGGVGMPSLDQVYQSAFSQLPVEEAVKAVEAATRYVAQRGYQKDIQGGADPIQTFAKYAPLMFRQATGLPEVFQAQMQRAKMAQPTIHQAGGGLYRIPQFGAAETLVPPRPEKPAVSKFVKVNDDLYELAPGQAPRKVVQGVPKPDESVTESYKIPAKEGVEAQPASKGFLGIGAHPAVAAVEPQPERTIRKTRKVTAADATLLNPAQTKKTNEVVRVTKDGKKAVFDADTKKFIRYAE